MSNEEAIELLQGMLEGLAGGENILELKLTMGALDMAIKALQENQKLKARAKKWKSRKKNEN